MLVGFLLRLGAVPYSCSVAIYHPIFGPIVMVVYACLSNTLLVTGKSDHQTYFLDLTLPCRSTCLCECFALIHIILPNDHVVDFVTHLFYD